MATKEKKWKIKTRTKNKKIRQLDRTSQKWKEQNQRFTIIESLELENNWFELENKTSIQ